MPIRTMGMTAWLAAAVVGTAYGQASMSATPAAKVANMLKDRGLRHIAAPDPNERGRYVAAMLVGDSMVFLVSARYSQPVLLNERLWRGDHEGAYLELNSASMKAGKLFVQDLGAPGLHAERADAAAFDIVFESGDKRTAFDGDWKAQGLSKEAYLTAFQSTDKQYAQALETLLAALAQPAASDTARR